jgi:hypothetical protein
MIEQRRITLLVIVAPHRGLELRHRGRIEGAQIRLSRPAGKCRQQHDRGQCDCQHGFAAHDAIPLAGPAGIVFDEQLRLAGRPVLTGNPGKPWPVFRLSMIFVRKPVPTLH